MKRYTYNICICKKNYVHILSLTFISIRILRDNNEPLSYVKILAFNDKVIEDFFIPLM